MLTVVGCSGSVVGPDGAASSYLLEKDGFVLLLDIGSGAASPLQRLVDVDRLDAVVISHAHQDHWADLNQLAYLRARGTAPALPVLAPADLPTSQLDHAGHLAVESASCGEHRRGPFRLRLARVPHTPESWAVRVDDALCYTGDTAYGPAIRDLAAGCRVLLAECSAFDADPHAGHLSAGDAGRLATESGASLLVLTHLRPWHDHAGLLREATREAACPVVTAAPGLRVAV